MGNYLPAGMQACLLTPGPFQDRQKWNLFQKMTHTKTASYQAYLEHFGGSADMVQIRSNRAIELNMKFRATGFVQSGSPWNNHHHTQDPGLNWC